MVRLYSNFMFDFGKSRDISTDSQLRKVAKKQLEKNREIFESLKLYDEGKKEISTTNVKKHLHTLQRTS